MRVNISIADFADVRAEANHGRFELYVYDKDGVLQGLQTLNVGSQGKALRLAGAFNFIMQDETSPIFPADREMEAAA